MSLSLAYGRDLLELQHTAEARIAEEAWREVAGISGAVLKPGVVAVYWENRFQRGAMAISHV